MSAEHVTLAEDTQALVRAERKASAAERAQTMSTILETDPDCVQLRALIEEKKAKLAEREAAVSTARNDVARLKRERRKKVTAAADGDKASTAAVVSLRKEAAAAGIALEDGEVLVEETAAHLERLRVSLAAAERIALQRWLAELNESYRDQKVAIEAALADVGKRTKAFDSTAFVIMDVIARITGKSASDRIRCKLSLKEAVNNHVLGEYVEPWARDMASGPAGVSRSGVVLPFDRMGEGDGDIGRVLALDLKAPAAGDSGDDEDDDAAPPPAA